MTTAEEAETSTAGEHLVKEYSVETHAGDRPGLHGPGFLSGKIIGVDLFMPVKTHLRCGPGVLCHGMFKGFRR